MSEQGGESVVKCAACCASNVPMEAIVWCRVPVVKTSLQKILTVQRGNCQTSGSRVVTGWEPEFKVVF